MDNSSRPVVSALGIFNCIENLILNKFVSSGHPTPKLSIDKTKSLVFKNSSGIKPCWYCQKQIHDTFVSFQPSHSIPKLTLDKKKCFV